MLKNYLEKLTSTTIQGDAREESYYPHLAELFKLFAESIEERHVHITILPKKTEAGNPDFRVWDGSQHIIGYIEAKKPGANLDSIELSEQLQRYRETFPNLILTDFYKFRLYRNGERVDKEILIGRPVIAKKLRTTPPVENLEAFNILLKKFYSFSLPKVYTPETLAIELAKRTRFLRDEIMSELEKEKKQEGGAIIGFYEAFTKYLIAGLKEEEFADLYSQTVTYGLFAARTKAQQQFNRKLAYSYIPSTIGILRDVFEFISLGKLPLPLEVIIDDIAEVLYVAEVNTILQNYYKQGKGEDPIIHFYETFLNKYDPTTREKRGVYYTPEPVVNYIVNSIHRVLTDDFSTQDGFANTSVTVLDPAGGTLTFLAQTSKHALQTFVENYGAGGQHHFIKDHILQNYYAFELMMAPYAIGHLKMSFLLSEVGYDLGEDDRFKLYLTNTLELEDLEQTYVPGISSLSAESKAAGLVKKQKPILVILGNPPYSQKSYNKSPFIDKLMELYKKDVKDEKNIQILTDDYVKFIRFCHWKIEQAHNGIIGLITKNTYLNVSACKGMRKQLLEYFDKIYVLNLHGRLYEKTPGGGKDENVFDIRVGTAILLLIKDNSKREPLGKLYYQDLYGAREKKYDYLNANTVRTTSWEKLTIGTEHYFFEKKNFNNPDLYNSFFSVGEDIFQKDGGGSGVETGRDHFILADDKKELQNRLQNFLYANLPIDLLRTSFNLEDQANFKLEKVKVAFKQIEEFKFYPYAHKPFYNRAIYYDKCFLRRESKKVMQNFILGDNIGLVLKKRYNDKNYSHCFVTQTITDRNFLGGQTYIFPLYTYSKQSDAFKSPKHSNLKPEFEEFLQKTYAQSNLTESIFYYIYAILHSTTYRESFPELLKIGFPKIPFPADYELFIQLSILGKELTELHLLKSEGLSKPIVRFQGEGEKGENKVTNIKYEPEEHFLKMNETQFFDHISPEIWEYEVGKNKVTQRWIKQKIGLTLSLNQSIEFCRIATAIQMTFKIQQKIDELYEVLEASEHLTYKRKNR